MTSLETVRARFTSSQGLPFAEVLTEARILEVLDEHQVEYRDRMFGPITTIWGFLSHALSDDHSCRDAVSRILAHRTASGLQPCSPNTASDCDARSRLLNAVLRTLDRILPSSCSNPSPRRGSGMAKTSSSPTARTSLCPTPQRTRRPTRRRWCSRRASAFPYWGGVMFTVPIRPGSRSGAETSKTPVANREWIGSHSRLKFKNVCVK